MDYALLLAAHDELAALIVGILHSEGIPVLEKPMGFSGWLGRSAAPGGGVRIFVPEPFLERSRELLESLKGSAIDEQNEEQ